jgi:hypothetical protein
MERIDSTKQGGRNAPVRKTPGNPGIIYYQKLYKVTKTKQKPKRESRKATTRL